jgi:hypothetical protein
MSAWSQQLRAVSLPALIARAAGWLIAPEAGEEAESEARVIRSGIATRPPRTIEEPEAPASPAPRRRGGAEPRPPLALAPPVVSAPEALPPVVAVIGLAAGAGASTIARAVAARLAAVDPCGAAILVTPDPPRAGLGSAAASRLARTLADRGTAGPRAAGRLCLVHASEPLAPIVAQRSAPVVADIAHGSPTEGAVALADHVVLVCAPDLEPALASAVESALRGAGHAVSLVLNRTVEEPPPGLEHALEVPESRMAAQLTLACREPRGALGDAAAELAARSLEEAL